MFSPVSRGVQQKGGCLPPFHRATSRSTIAPVLIACDTSHLPNYCCGGAFIVRNTAEVVMYEVDDKYTHADINVLATLLEGVPKI
jgi:hypothetical protein